MQNTATAKFFIRQIRGNKASGTSYSQLKYFYKWKKALAPNASSVKDEQPWITYDVIEFLKSKVNSESRIFEYGGGGSTLFFTKSAKEVITVEHNDEWFQILSKNILDKKYSNWKGVFVAAQKGDFVSNPDRAIPEHYSSDDESYKSFHFKDYASHIDKFKDAYFDFVLVDGRSRASCIKHSIPKIKSNGYLILDNSDRTYYLEHFKDVLNNEFDLIIDNFGASPYCDLFTKTSVWRKK